MEHTIELDCPPGGTRPGDLLAGVIEGLGLELDPKKPDGMFFGNWTWNIPACQNEAYVKARDTVQQRITALYNRGLIRYGSW